MSRSDSKPLADAYDFAFLRKSILIPAGVENASLRTDGPFAYRDLDECLALIEDYAEVITRFGVVGYMGHLWPRTANTSWQLHCLNSPAVANAKRLVYLKLMEKNQNTDPFKFILYSGKIAEQTPQMAATK